jgi:GNAT superfamily N-acetyltransferase
MNALSTPTTIRRATRDDGDSLLSLVDALAAYEKLTPPDAAAKNRLLHDLFAERPRIEALIAIAGDRPAGYAFILETYSSFLALPTLYLEDLFILPEYRSKGIGFALFRAVVAEARARGCGRMEWTVLDWNTLALDFYRRAGATHLREWQLFRLTKPEMDRILGVQSSFTADR